MEGSYWIFIILALVLSAFFSGMEIAFVTASRFKVELENKSGSYLANMLLPFFNRPARFIGTMLLGNNVALVVYGMLMAALLDPFIAEFTGNRALILLIQTLVSTLIILVFAEFLPKTIFRLNSNGLLKVFSIPLWVIYVVLWVPSVLIIGVSELVLRIFFRVKVSQSEATFGKVDIDHYLDQYSAKHVPEEEVEHEIQIFKNALDFENVKARECMVPRTEIVALSIDESVEELRDTFVRTGLTKIMIYRNTIDNIIGYAHSFEMFKQPDAIKNILLPVSIVPESMAAQEVMEMLISQHRSIAVVVDEFGGTSGILTIEDVMEEIFGEIEDEHDQEVLHEEDLGNGEFRFAARLEVDYLNEEYDLKIPEAEDYETIGGYVISEFGRIPEVNEYFSTDSFSVYVEEVSENRIEMLKFKVHNGD